MWHELLIKNLRSKIKKSDLDRFDFYINNLFSNINSVVKPDPFPAELALGLVEKMYEKYEHVSENSTPLKEFAEHLFGLSMLYTKSAFDGAIWNKHFITVNKSNIFQSLFKFDPNKSIINCVNDIERRVFAELDHSVTINFQALLTIFSKQDITILNLIKEDLSLLSNENSPFTTFINNISDLINNNLDPTKFSKKRWHDYVKNSDLYTSIEPILTQLDVLNRKAGELKDKKHVLEAESAFLLVHQIKYELKHYIDSFNPNDNEARENFVRKSKGFISAAEPLLSHHRGCKNILANLGLALLGVGVIYLLAATANYLKNNRFFFNLVNTDSKNELNKLESCTSNLIQVGA